MMGCVHLRMHTPQVCGLPEHTLEVVKETKRKKEKMEKGERGNEQCVRT